MKLDYTLNMPKNLLKPNFVKCPYLLLINTLDDSRPRTLTAGWCWRRVKIKT